MRPALLVTILIALHALAVAEPAATRASTSAERDERDAPRRARAPSISAVLSAAYAAAGLDRDPGRGWIRRTRLAGLVPWMTVRTARDTSWQDSQSEVGHGTSLEVRATWRLDRLLFDGRELQVATIEAARRRERTRLASHVIRAYFAWRRAEAASRATADASRDDDAAPRRAADASRAAAEAARDDDETARGADDRSTTRVAEATAELDALTDGWFSEQLARPRAGSAGDSTTP